MPPKDTYKIIWKNEALNDTKIKADSEEKARILARAEKIKQALDDRIEIVIKETDYR